MMKQELPECTVYWLHNSTCGLIEDSGYVGITKQDPEDRKKSHFRNKRVPLDCVMDIILEGTRSECGSEELRLRPDFNIGWNKAKGGARGSVGGYCSLETRAKLSASHKGKTPSPESRAKLSKSLTGRTISPKTRAKLSKSLTGRKLTPETRAKISEAARGRTTSPETRAKLSAAATNPSPETRAKLSAAATNPSPETRAKLSASAKRAQARIRANKLASEELK